MAYWVERCYNAGLFYSLLGRFISLVMSNDVCMGPDFVDGDIMVGGF